jgi:2,5-diamino-6-(ribosylamino)-4(3H)-pyrimidinone 5'-phosphate reductase
MRPYVICHMMPSVDGRLRTDRWDIPNSAHGEYERTAETFRADAWICGRKTMEEFASGRRRPRRGRANRRHRPDFVVPRDPGTNYAVAIDSRGTLPWSAPDTEGDPLVEVLTADAPNEYVTFLRDKGISYLFAGRDAGKVNLPLALRKLRENFGVKRLLLEGGGETNGSFLRAKLVNELSLLVTPVADGGIGEPALFDVEGQRPARAVARLALKSARRIGAGMVWLRYTVRNAS